jgi:hypothetical protein
MITQKQADVLKILSDNINKTTNWTLMGSMSLALHGMAVNVKDIDILTNKKGVFEIEKALNRYVITTTKIKQYSDRKAYRVVLNIKGIEVEALADIQENLQEKSRLSAKQFVEFNKLKLPIVDLTRELNAYKNWGKPNKVKLIEEYLKRLD